MNNVFNISYTEYRSTYLNFASKYAIEGPISYDTLNTIIYYMNSEYLDNYTIDKISDSNYVCQDNLTNDYIQKAIEELKKYNINAYYKGETPILLSDTIIIKNQIQALLYIENLLKNIKDLPQEEAINSYVELKDIILHKNLENYKFLNNKQQSLIEKIYLPVANNLFDYRNNAKQYKLQ